MHEADNAYSIRSTRLCYRHLLITTTDFVALYKFTGYVVFIITLFLAGAESENQCLLNSEVLSYFSGVIMSIRSFFYFRELDRFLCWWIFGPRGNLESCIIQRHTYLSLATLNMDGNKEKNASRTARKEGRMSSCKWATSARS